MDFKQLRTALTDHFSSFLAARKAQIDETGPLSEADRTARDFIRRYELDVRADSPLFEAFKRSIAQAQRDYAKCQSIGV